MTAEPIAVVATTTTEDGAPITSVDVQRVGGIKVRLTLGPALIDLEATLEEIVVVVTRLTQEFTKAAIIAPGAGFSVGIAPEDTPPQRPQKK